MSHPDPTQTYEDEEPKDKQYIFSQNLALSINDLKTLYGFLPLYPETQVKVKGLIKELENIIKEI